MKLIFLGPPGGGKGTIAARLVQEYKLQHISTGNIFRDEIRQQTVLGKKAKTIIDQGNLVPDSLTIEIVKQRITGKDNYVLDGFPRTIAQAKAVEDQKITIVLLIEVPEKVIIERLSLRRTCQQGHVYHLKNNPPKKAGICDIDKTSLSQREDDTVEIITNRLKVYQQQTAPLIQYYEQKKLLQKVNGNQGIEKVYAAVKKALDK